MELIRSLHSELFKISKTKAFYLSFLAPLSIVVLQFLSILLKSPFYYASFDYSLWPEYFKSTGYLWLLLMIPLYIGLGTSMITNIEYSSGGWKQLFATSVSRKTIYISKLITGIIFLALSTLFLYITSIFSALLLDVLRSDLVFYRKIPYASLQELAIVLATTYIGIFLLLSIMLWISFKFRSFFIPIGLSIVGVISNIMITSSTTYSRFSPWMIPVNIANNLNEKGMPNPITYGFTNTTYIWMSIGIGLLFTLFALKDIQNKDID